MKYILLLYYHIIIYLSYFKVVSMFIIVTKLNKLRFYVLKGYCGLNVCGLNEGAVGIQVGS